MAGAELGEFLRGRRAQVGPAAVGLPEGDGRRVPGLRREEVAQLAGVSLDYYVRLEQGRERGPSAQVLDALGRVLRLDADGRLHLFRLAGLAPRAFAPPGAERVGPELRQLLDMWPDNPALVLGRAYDVLARNRLAEALFNGFTFSRNLMLTVFLDPQARTFYADWPYVASNSAAGLRLAMGEAPGDPRMEQIVARLLAQSPEFAELWAENDAHGRTMPAKSFNHPQVGELMLHRQTFDVRSSPGQQLVVYHAEPGSVSAKALRLLGGGDAPSQAG